MARRQLQEQDKASFLSAIVAPLLIAVAIFLVDTLTTLPPVQPVDSDPTLFSAERAREHVVAMASKPHPMGTPANKEVRDYVLSALSALGLEGETTASHVRRPTPNFGCLYYGAYVENVMAVIEGSRPELPAILLMSHYDSVHNAPGAADNASGSAVLLEVARALKAGPQAERSVVLLFTDGEEAGLFGARAFFENPDVKDRFALVINTEARGSSGPAYMFETSANNQALIDLYRSVAERPMANSLMASIYRIMRNDTDLSEAIRAGVPSMNFAFIDGYYDYHTAGDSVQNLSLESVQHMGGEVLALTKIAARADTDFTATEDSVYTDLMSRGFIAMSPDLAVLPVLLALALTVAVLAVKGDRTGSGAQQALKGLAILILSAVIIGVLMQILFSVFVAPGSVPYGPENRRLMATGNTLMLGYMLLGSSLIALMMTAAVRSIRMRLSLPVAVLLGLGTLLITRTPDIRIALFVFAAAGVLGLLLRSKTARTGLSGGGLLLLTLLAVLASIYMPGASYLFSIPACWIALGHLILSRPANLTARRLLPLGLFALPGLLWFLWLAPLLYWSLAVPFMAPALFVVPLLIIAALLVPQFVAAMRGWTGPLILATGLAVTLWSALLGDFSARYRAPDDLFIFHDASTGESRWASRLPAAGEWAKERIAEPLTPMSLDIGPFRRFIRFNVADPLEFTGVNAPTIRAGDEPERYHIVPASPGDLVAVAITSDTPLPPMYLEGRNIFCPVDDRALFILHQAVPEDGLKLRIVGGASDALKATLYSVTYQPDQDVANLFPLIPAHVMPTPYGLSNALVTKSVWPQGAQKEEPTSDGR